MTYSEVKNFANIFACSSDRQAIHEWTSHIQDMVEKKGVEYAGPYDPPSEKINGKRFFTQKFRIAYSKRTKDIIELEPPDNVYLQIGVGARMDFSVEDVVPEKEIPGPDEQYNSDIDDDSDESETPGNPSDPDSDSDQGNDGSPNSVDPSLENLREEAEESAVEEVPQSATTTQQTKQEYSRSSEVREYVMARADGECEGCGEPAPFTSTTGEPYLHAHHIHELSDGGSDTPDTVVALCPNCHYRVHHGEDGEEYNQVLLQTVREIESQ